MNEHPEECVCVFMFVFTNMCVCVCVNQERSQPVSAGMGAPLGHFHTLVFLSAFQLDWRKTGIEQEKGGKEGVMKTESEKQKGKREEGRRGVMKEGKRRDG